MIPVFIFLKKIGKFRVPREVEIKGLDIFKHGEAAYPLAAYGHGWEESDHQDALPISKEDPAGVHARNGNDIALTQRHPGQVNRKTEQDPWQTFTYSRLVKFYLF